MISSVTSSVAAAITSAWANIGLANSLSLVAILALIALLIQKEFVSSNTSQWSFDLERGLNIGIVPLGLAFLIIAGVQLLAVLG